MEAKVKVFIKCLRCGTFITSASIVVLAKHLEKCWSGVELECIGDTDNFISDQTQSFTFTQPSVVLVNCGLERSNLKLASKQALGNNDDTRRYPVPTSIARKEFQNKRKGASTQPHLEAIKKPKLVPIPELETTTDPAFVVDSDLAWNMEAVQIDTDNLEPCYDPKIWFCCDSCSAKYTKEALLIRHKNSIHVGHSGEIFTCSICNRMLKNRRGLSGLQGHLLRHQEAEALEKQLNLWKKWPTKTTTKNRRVIYSCKYCLMKLTNHPDFLSHMVTDHSDKMEHSSFQCPHDCVAQLDSIKELIDHFRSTHPQEYFGPLPPSRVIKIKRKKKNEKCDKCGRWFSQDYLAKHKEINHSDTSAVRPEGSCSCAYPGCEIKCQSVRNLRRHFILHLEKNPYACNFPNCSVKCGDVSILKMHIQRKHLDVPVTCTKCGVTYANADTLKRHECDANVKKLQSGNYELEQIGGFFKLKLVESKRRNGVKFVLFPARISSEDNIGLADKVDQYVESLKLVNIDAVIRSDPGFVQACQNSPGFRELLLDHHSFGENPQPFQRKRTNLNFSANKTFQVLCEHCGKAFANLNYRNAHMRRMHGVTVPLPKLKPKRRNIWKGRRTKAISKLSKFSPKTEQAIKQVKIEPELIISDDAFAQRWSDSL